MATTKFNTVAVYRGMYRGTLLTTPVYRGTLFFVVPSPRYLAEITPEVRKPHIVYSCSTFLPSTIKIFQRVFELQSGHEIYFKQNKGR